MDHMGNQTIIERLKKIEGQTRGVMKMLDDGRYCIDILTQTRAIAQAIRKVEEIVLERHLTTCVSDSMKSDNEKDKQKKIAEIMQVIGKMNGK